MAAVRLWARSVFAISVLVSTLMLLVPKSMVKQAKFAAEMLILLAVLTPFVGLLVRGSAVPASIACPEGTRERFALDRYLASEMTERVGEMIQRAGFAAKEVSVETTETGYRVAAVTVVLSGDAADDRLAALEATLSAYLSVPAGDIRIRVEP